MEEEGSQDSVFGKCIQEARFTMNDNTSTQGPPTLKSRQATPS